MTSAAYDPAYECGQAPDACVSIPNRFRNDFSCIAGLWFVRSTDYPNGSPTGRMGRGSVLG